MRALATTFGDEAIGLLDHQTRGLTQDVGTAMQGHYTANVLDTLPYQVRVSGQMGFKKTVHAERFAA
jgi:hypothetical protein